ncbi:thiaminase II [Marinicrinis lubricantis]|uniref:Aminopyrimidine aminohydrolase n=1 Tax=Marinicrinis lubricantis TaxID=2086470 RepID=A0ABW1IPP8_9BACL
MTFCEEVRKETDLYWKASIDHPFVKGIADGTLPLEKFRFYMMQDAFYLKHYAKVLAMAAAKAESQEDLIYFLNTAKYITEAELELHRSVFQELNVTEQEFEGFEAAPASYNYVSHMYSAIHNGDVSEAFAAILPCPWLYLEVGQYYKNARPGVSLYEDWIQLYSSREYEASVLVQIDMMNRFADPSMASKRTVLKQHFKKSCYYEWKFWEMAWTLEDWGKEVEVYDFAANS